MNKEDIPLYKLDLEGNSQFNKVTRESRSRSTVKNNHIFVPLQAPFYHESFKLYAKDGTLLTEGEDYEFYGILGKLTQYTGKSVGLFVRLLKDEITEWSSSYQVVGNFNKLTNEILNMIHSIYEDDRYVDWENIENKPLWFVPEIHQHDLAYEIYGFGDLARELNRIADIIKVSNSPFNVEIRTFIERIHVYIKGFREVLLKLIKSHESNKFDAHGVQKDQIGLENVDNFLTATLEETVEGLRSDLHITPYLAAETIAIAAGRNDKLYPSGTMPLLRYGSDTFIPPTISGSFEGLGGLDRAHGAIVENNGTLLILQHRNNGKVRGCYFTRSVNWKSNNAVYEFTTYRYLHPTATADGANLDRILNGSNSNIMVIGDSVKNIWYWCETNGTFNPDRHVLNRIQGDWLTFSNLSTSSNPYHDLPCVKACVIADSSYKEGWFIFQPLPSDIFYNKARKDYTYAQLKDKGMVLANMGYAFFGFVGMSDKGVQCKINFEHPKFGNFDDKYFTPWWPEFSTVADDPNPILSYFADYENGNNGVMCHRTAKAVMLSSGEVNKWGLRLEVSAREGTDKGLVDDIKVFRGGMALGGVGDDLTLTIVPAPSNDHLYEVDLFNPDPDHAEYRAYKANMSGTSPDDCDTVGFAVIAGRHMCYSDGYGNGTFPSTYAIWRNAYLNSVRELLLVQGTGFNKPIYNSLYKSTDDVNPLGLTGGLTGAYFMSGDTDNALKSGVLTRQTLTTGTEWIWREAAHTNSNWTHKKPTNHSTFNGNDYLTYPVTQNVKKVNFKQQLRIDQIIPNVNGSLTNLPVRFIFGVSGTTTYLGDRLPTPIKSQPGDSIWMYDMDIKTEGGSIVVRPKSVIRMAGWVDRYLVTKFGALGVPADQVRKTWSVSRHYAANGRRFDTLQVCHVTSEGKARALMLSCLITEAGSNDKSKGYNDYSDCKITEYGNVVIVESEAVVRENERDIIVHQFNDKESSKIIPGGSVSWPWKTLDITTNSVTDGSTFTVMHRSCTSFLTVDGRSRWNVALEIDANTGVIVEAKSITPGYWNSLDAWIPTPYYGLVSTASGLKDLETSGVGGQTIKHQTPYQSLINRTLNSERALSFTNSIVPSFVVYFGGKKDILLSGRMYDVSATFIDIRAQDPSPANKTYYAYLSYDGVGASYSISSDIIPETASSSLIAVIYCGATQIDRIVPYNVFSMDGVQLSAKRKGSAILASSGSVWGIGDTDTILANEDFIPEDEDV